MAHINLLPWRDERRKLREREFYGQLFMAFIAGLIVVIAWAFWMGRRIDNQHDRNAYLKDQIKQVDTKIAKIKNLEKVRSQLLKRKQIIEKLQSNRSQMVHMFDALVKTIPDSVRLTSLTQNGQQLELHGVAQSNASVADYMKRLAASPWMGAPHLGGTANHHDGSRTPYSFNLGVTLAKPTEAEQQAAEQKSASTADGGSVTVTPDDAANAAAATSVAPPANVAPAARRAPAATTTAAATAAVPAATSTAPPHVALPVVAPQQTAPAPRSASADHGEGQS